ncbi:MAG: hypothetical protein SFT93_00850 [Rickettsiaceae bacterium]|nr:hypothetical protein [Rickettsiaceae bacterium]
MACNEKKMFKEQGVLTEGSIVRKYKTHHRFPNYYLTIYFFTQPRQENLPKKDTSIIQKNKEVNEIIKDIGKNIQEIKIGKFISAEVQVTEERYNKYALQTQVKLYYLKNNPQKIELQEVIDR